MKTIGFPISHKENEYRRALIPNDISKIVNRKNIFIEFDYGKVLGFSDNDFRDLGVNVVSREVVLQQDIICDPKIGDADYVRNLSSQTIFGWIHAVQNRQITDILMNHKLTAYAWEEMIYKGRHLFWENNEIAGEAAVIHAFQCYGILPRKTKVAILGKGNIARGAQRALICFGAEITVYDRKTESLLREELSKYDVVINAILWDIRRKDHIIYLENLKKNEKRSNYYRYKL